LRLRKKTWIRNPEGYNAELYALKSLKLRKAFDFNKNYWKIILEPEPHVNNILGSPLILDML